MCNEEKRIALKARVSARTYEIFIHVVGLRLWVIPITFDTTAAKWIWGEQKLPGAQKSKFATRHAGCQYESVLKVRVKDVIYLFI